MSVITRIPPSPTGHLHIGTARTALFNYLFARKHSGSFIFRSEDTDRARSTSAFETEIIQGLAWLGLSTDSFSRQSERGDIYKNHLTKLIEGGVAYISKEESKQRPGEMTEVVRLKNQNKVIVFQDEVRGDISFDTTELGDFVIARSIDDALYHFAVVVDDYESGVTHVIRGEDHISNTPRQILIQEALGAPRPIYAHLPLILAPDRSKLSKRHGAVALEEYRHAGFLPEAIVNYLGLLGWNPGTNQELFTLEELVDAFDLKKIQKSGAIFDIEKLKWFNREYIKKTPDNVLDTAIQQAFQTSFSELEITPRITKNLRVLLRDRIDTLGDISKDIEGGEYDFLVQRPNPPPHMLAWKKDHHPKDALPRLEEAIVVLGSTSDSDDPEVIRTVLMPLAERVGKGEVLWPIRVALSGKEKSPDPFTIIALIGIPESIARIEHACAILRE